MKMNYLGIEDLRPANALEDEEEGFGGIKMNQTQRVLQLLIKNRTYFTQIIERLLENPLIRTEDKERLAVVNGAVARGETASFATLGQERPALAALVVAYAIYNYDLD